MHNHPPVDPDKPVNADFQDNDINQKAVWNFIIVSFVVTIVSFFAMLIVMKAYKARFIGERGVATVETRQIAGEDDALLQVIGVDDLHEYQALEQARLNGEHAEGTAKAIPVQIAMDLMIQEHAFKVRPGYEAPAEAPTSGHADSSHDAHKGAEHH